MKRTLLPAALLAVWPTAQADYLESMHEHPWVGYWVGYEDREFDFGIGAKGNGELFLKQRQKGEMTRISAFRSLKMRYLLEEKAGDNWISRSMVEDGFETSQDPSGDVEKAEFEVSYKGGGAAKVTHTFERGEVHIGIEWVKKPEGKEARLGIEVIIPDLYRLKSDIEERELKEKLEDDEVRAVRVDNKKFKVEFEDDVTLSDEDVLGKGATEFEITSKQLADKSINLSNTKDKGGVFYFDQKNPLHEGFSVMWYPEESVADSQLIIEVD
ncbi:MAG: hypothetical protein Q7Q71_08895 [Verrucomicrobiota bacterium JB023]|nr:hypothetical protein [Verrucomicrobiota bacterium JB023]